MADQGADTFEFLEHEYHSGRTFVIRVYKPRVVQGEHGNDPLPLYAVLVTEVHPPKGEKPIEWLQLTNEPVIGFEDAWRVAGWYEYRWVVEEYHQGMKTGCGVEELQFTTVARLQPAIALLSAVALPFLDLRDASRRDDAATRPATMVVHGDYVAVLTAWRYGEIRADITVHDFYYALARLGGHQNRTHDKRPGWLVLWRGWVEL